MLTAYYDVYARVWNSTDPSGTVMRVEFNGGADLRTGSASGLNVTLN